MDNQQPATAQTQDDQRGFTRLCEKIADRLLFGESVDLDELVRVHPRHASSLREFFPVMKAMADLGLSVSHSPESKRSRHETDIREFGTLGDFQIEEEIGRGGMGIVYRARQISLDRTVALKVLPYVSVLEERQISRFKNEAKAAARLKHPNIVSVHSVGCQRGVHYYAMELVEGESLAHVIRQLRDAKAEPHRAAGSVTETRSVATLCTDYSKQRHNFYRAAARLGIQAAEALQFAHDQAIVHRDIKPSNLLLDGQGKLWITDFGLARIEADHSLTMSGDVLGTLRYMSPEQATGRNGLDERTDIYSLGLSLYELATLQAAFDGSDRAALTRQVTEGELRRPRKVESTIPADLETIILRAIAQRPEDRFATAQELADDLQRFLDHRPILARKITPTERARRWVGRNPTVASLLGLVLSGLLFLAIAGPVVAIRQTRLLDREQRQLYVAHMNMAYEALQHGDFERVSELLELHNRPGERTDDLRGFEWYYLSHQIEFGWQAPASAWWCSIYGAQFSPDGKNVVFGAWDGTLKVCSSWDLCELKVIEGRTTAKESHLDWIRGIAYSPNGKWLVTVSRDGVLKLWRTKTWELVDEAALGMEGTAVAISAQGKVAVGLGANSFLNALPSAEPTRIRVFQIRQANEEQADAVQLAEYCDLEEKAGRVRSLDFSPDGKTLIAGCDDRVVRRWSVESKVAMPALTGHQGPVMSATFSPDGHFIATGSGTYHDRRWTSGEVNLWRAKTGRLVRKFHGHTAGVSAAVFSADGRYLATGSHDRTIRVWHIESGDLRHTLHGHSNSISSLDFSPDGTQLVSGGADDQVKLWPLPRATARQRIAAHESDIIGMAFTPDNRFVATASVDHTVKIWNARTGELVRPLTTQDRGLSFAAISPDGDRLASGGHYMISRNLPTMVKIWDFRSGDVQVECQGVDGECVEGAFSPDGKVLATGGKDGRVKIWNPSNGQLLHTLDVNDGHVLGLAFTPNGKYLVTSAGRLIVLWDTDRYRRVHTFEMEKEKTIFGLGVSRDGQLIAVAPGKSILLLDISRRILIRELHGQSETILSVGFSRDGKRLASGSTDGSVTLWDLKTGSQLMTFRDHTGWVWHVEFSPDGNTLASGCGHGILCLRRAPGLH